MLFLYDSSVVSSSSRRTLIYTRPCTCPGTGSSGRPAEAIPVLYSALDLKPTDSMSMNNLAVALVKTRRDAEAMSVYTRAIDIGRADKGNTPLWAVRGRGNALQRSGRHSEAVIDLETALQLSDTTDETVLTNLGLAQFALSHDDAAHGNLKAAVDTKRCSAPFHRILPALHTPFFNNAFTRQTRQED